MTFRTRAAAVFVASTLTFASPQAMLIEGIIKKAAAAENLQAPFQSKKIPALVKGISGSDEEKAASLFKLFKVGKGLLKMDDSKDDSRPPRAVDETLAKGGDCTEFMFVLLAAFEQLGLKGGVATVHLDSAPESIDHVLAYVLAGDTKIFVDPQAAELGSILDGSGYKLVSDVTPEQAKAIHYRELGNYYFKNEKYAQAAAEYITAIKFNGNEAFVHDHLGFIYEKLGKPEEALRHREQAAKLKPEDEKYHQKFLKAKYQYFKSIAEEAFVAGKFAEAKSHFEDLLEAAKALSMPKTVLDGIKRNIKLCESNMQ